MIFKDKPMSFKDITKVEGPVLRHIEQLWDEIRSLRKRVSMLETCNMRYILEESRKNDSTKI